MKLVGKSHREMRSTKTAFSRFFFIMSRISFCLLSWTSWTRLLMPWGFITLAPPTPGNPGGGGGAAGSPAPIAASAEAEAVVSMHPSLFMKYGVWLASSMRLPIWSAAWSKWFVFCPREWIHVFAGFGPDIRLLTFRGVAPCPCGGGGGGGGWFWRGIELLPLLRLGIIEGILSRKKEVKVLCSCMLVYFSTSCNENQRSKMCPKSTFPYCNAILCTCKSYISIQFPLDSHQFSTSLVSKCWK